MSSHLQILRVAVLFMLFPSILAVRRMASSANGGYIRKVPCIWLTGIDLLDFSRRFLS
jgi:hypothetical protein